jgi:site-specific DNA-cytosine methylase
VGSYEDAAFGTEWQLRNFPELAGLLASHRDLWPTTVPLDETVVIAHPPCAAFSIQGSSRKDRDKRSGLDSEHFKCTVEVMKYAMGLRCAALIIESVQRAHEGAREVHDLYANSYEYSAYRILLNAATFGLPQWRPRFWIVFMRNDIAPAALGLAHNSDCITVSEFLSPYEPGISDARLDLNQQRHFLNNEMKMDPLITEAVLSTPGNLAASIRAKLALDTPLHLISREWCLRPTQSNDLTRRRMGVWITETLYVLDPQGTSPVILHNSWWAYNGRAVTPIEYRRIMGFPPDYFLDKNYRMWLSKGVCPPIAAFLLDRILESIEGKSDLSGMTCVKGETLDMQISKPEWRVRAGVAEPEATVMEPRTRSVTVSREPRTPKVKTQAKWIATLDENVCETCREYDGKTIAEILGDNPNAEMMATLLSTYCTNPFGCRCAVAKGPPAIRAPRTPREPGDPVEAVVRPEFEVRVPREKVSKKKRVVLEFVYTTSIDIPQGALEVAFMSRKDVVCPSLLEVVSLEGREARVKLQYEPPNTGGHRGDVTRIADRGRRALDAMGLGPVELREV